MTSFHTTPHATAGGETVPLSYVVTAYLDGRAVDEGLTADPAWLTRYFLRLYPGCQVFMASGSEEYDVL